MSRTAGGANRPPFAPSSPAACPAVEPDRAASNQRLAPVAPEIVEAVLDGRPEELVWLLPVDWDEQRRERLGGHAR